MIKGCLFFIPLLCSTKFQYKEKGISKSIYPLAIAFSNGHMLNRNLNNPILLILKDSVGLVDLVEAEGVGDQWGCIDH